ncbi:MAG: hypothetical protein ABSE55_07195 [Terracidiphilus sp.]|jgi:hypothetical protein
MRFRFVHAIWFTAISLTSISIFAQETQGSQFHKAALTPVEYKSLLDRIETDMAVWDASARKIDPAKTNASYALGTQIAQNRDVVLLEIRNIRSFIAMQRQKHTVSGELAISGFLQSITGTMEDEVMLEIASQMSITDFEHFASEQFSLEAELGMDLQARVKMLEEGTCR